MWHVLADNFGHHQAILQKYRITGYFWYVDDILTLYSLTHAATKEIWEEFNNISPNLKFTMGQEQKNTLKFLDSNYM
jgi:hypothetical protein